MNGILAFALAASAFAGETPTGPLSELVPAPKCVTATGATAADDLPIRFVKAAVADAPEGIAPN